MTLRGALITPPGPAGIAVVRIIGPQSYTILETIFRTPSGRKISSFPPHRLLLGSIYEDQEQKEIIDQVIVVYNLDHQSVEITCHGGPRIIQRLLLLLQKHQVEIVPWQELHTATTLPREVASTLPQALTRKVALSLAAQYPTGLYSWSERTIQKLQKDPQQLTHIQTDIQKLLPSFKLAQKLLTPPLVVLTGPVNVGKSTLANALTGKTQSITSELPGTTRDWTVRLADILGFPVNLVDTAGRRDDTEHLERRSLEQADKQIHSAQLIILLLEANGREKEQIAFQWPLLPRNSNPLIVINKCDLSPQADQNREHLRISALTGMNLDILREAIVERLGLIDFDPLAPLISTRRQYDLLSSAAQTSECDMALAYIKELTGS